MVLIVSTASNSTDKTAQLIKRVISAYGGNELTHIDTIQLQDQFKTFRYGQSYRPEEVDIENNHVDVLIDSVKKRKDARWVIGSKDDYYIRHWLFDGSKGYAISHANKTIAQNDRYSFDTADRNHSHLLDTVIVQALINKRTSAKWLGKIDFLGHVHDRLKFPLSKDTAAELYIHQQSGFITYMEKINKNTKRTLRYHYQAHKKQQGLVYAQQAHMTRGGDPYILITARQVKFNQKIGSAFDLPYDYDELPATIDMTVMAVQKVTTGVYLVGQGWGHSVFVDVGKGFIAAGGYSMLTERYNAVKAFTKIDKPLLKMVVSHHHHDHIRGMSEAIELGAILIVVKDHVDVVKDEVRRPLTGEHFELVESKASFADGKLMVFDIPTGHSTHNLMTYIPAAKLLFTADTYYSRQVSGVPYGGPHLKKIKDQLNSFNLPVEKFAAAHSTRILTTEDFTTSMTKSIEPVCPKTWSICHIMQTR